MPTRPPVRPQPDSTSSTRLRHPHIPVHRLYQLFARLTFFVVPAKLEDDLATIYDCILELGGLCVKKEEARIIITALSGRPRLTRAIGAEWMGASLDSHGRAQPPQSSKPILAVEYIYDTFDQCLLAANSPSSPLPKLPSRDKYLVIKPQAKGGPGPSAVDIEGDESPAKRFKANVRVPSPVTSDDAAANSHGLPDLEPFPEDIVFEEIPRMCVKRASPLICINQDIIDAIRPIYEDREFEETQQKNSNVLSYRRSMSIIKALPRRLKSGKEARRLQDVGEKVAQRIDEYLQTGRIEESEEILLSERFNTLRLFASIYSIGHHTAKDLYDRHHCRSLEDVRQHYIAVAEESEAIRLKEKNRRRREGGMTNADIVEEWMALREELNSKISRTEVEEIAECVAEHLSAILPGCQYTLTGGYRRGKTQSSDVDVVFCPPNDDEDIGLLRDLYLRLSTLGIITHVLHVTHREANAPIHAAANNFDNLDKAFVIFRLPGKDRLHRRVDLISSPKERYAAAVLSWSGSMMFERDLKRHADNHLRGLKFRAGLIESSTGREINLETEREIFHYLGLRYVPPQLRNADG